MKLVNKTAITAAVGAVVMGSALTASVQANPFGYTEMEAGYQLFAGEGKCGEGKCGGAK